MTLFFLLMCYVLMPYHHAKLRVLCQVKRFIQYCTLWPIAEYLWFVSDNSGDLNFLSLSLGMAPKRASKAASVEASLDKDLFEVCACVSLCCNM